MSNHVHLIISSFNEEQWEGKDLAKETFNQTTLLNAGHGQQYMIPLNREQGCVVHSGTIILIMDDSLT